MTTYHEFSMGCSSLHYSFVGFLWLQLMFPNKANATLIICSQTSSSTYKSEVFHPTSLSRKLDDTHMNESQHWSRSPIAPAGPSHCLASLRTLIQQREQHVFFRSATMLSTSGTWTGAKILRSFLTYVGKVKVFLNSQALLEAIVIIGVMCWFLPDHFPKNCAVLCICSTLSIEFYTAHNFLLPWILYWLHLKRFRIQFLLAFQPGKLHFTTAEEMLSFAPKAGKLLWTACRPWET